MNFASKSWHYFTQKGRANLFRLVLGRCNFVVLAAALCHACAFGELCLKAFEECGTAGMEKSGTISGVFFSLTLVLFS